MPGEWRALAPLRACLVDSGPACAASPGSPTQRDPSNAGARGIKCESSGIAHSLKRWLQFKDTPSDLYSAFVRRPLLDDVFFSNGLHLLGCPDVEVETQNKDQKHVLDYIDAFAHFVLLEDGLAKIATGHTFHPTPSAPKYKISFTACLRYDADDFFHNPHGYCRLSARRPPPPSGYPETKTVDNVAFWACGCF